MPNRISNEPIAPEMRSYYAQRRARLAGNIFFYAAAATVGAGTVTQFVAVDRLNDSTESLVERDYDTSDQLESESIELQEQALDLYAASSIPFAAMATAGITSYAIGSNRRKRAKSRKLNS